MSQKLEAHFFLRYGQHMATESMMTRCLELARQGEGKTHPNPMVGAVVVDKAGTIVGEGFHAAYGNPHAEVMALQQAGSLAQGATLYVNLEPCNHHGKTPPCTQAVLQAGIKTVVFGMSDPNPKVEGHGADALKAQGVEVISGVLERECQHLNEAFCHAVRHQRPFVVIKQAMTLDGKIATRQGESKWLTGPESKRFVHCLRSQSDAVLSTAETVIADNSQLTVREVALGQPPVRVVLDRRKRLVPETLAMFASRGQDAPIWVFTTASQTAEYADQIAAWGARVFEVQEDGIGLVLEQVLDILGKERITQVLVEGGGHLTGSFISTQLAQKLWLLYAPKMLPDPSATLGFIASPLQRLKDAPQLSIYSTSLFGGDIAVEAYFEYKKSL